MSIEMTSCIHISLYIFDDYLPIRAMASFLVRPNSSWRNRSASVRSPYKSATNIRHDATCVFELSPFTCTFGVAFVGYKAMTSSKSSMTHNWSVTIVFCKARYHRSVEVGGGYGVVISVV